MVVSEQPGPRIACTTSSCGHFTTLVHPSFSTHGTLINAGWCHQYCHISSWMTFSFESRIPIAELLADIIWFPWIGLSCPRSHIHHPESCGYQLWCRMGEWIFETILMSHDALLLQNRLSDMSWNILLIRCMEVFWICFGWSWCEEESMSDRKHICIVQLGYIQSLGIERNWGG
jgi:hypothetical protein